MDDDQVTDLPVAEPVGGLNAAELQVVADEAPERGDVSVNSN
ncbi:hypothetical protein [Rhodohalobacter sp.]|nr:hypothetical protein [Rhodohalobacter sp.]MDZ7756779.1 hypothetical protein [Rhodohalobacter sp.]